MFTSYSSHLVLISFYLKNSFLKFIYQIVPDEFLTCSFVTKNSLVYQKSVTLTDITFHINNRSINNITTTNIHRINSHTQHIQCIICIPHCYPFRMCRCHADFSVCYVLSIALIKNRVVQLTRCSVDTLTHTHTQMNTGCLSHSKL